ncbi:hypothetical protein GCM10029964_076010 [Kibdelosporangium lantanae]
MTAEERDRLLGVIEQRCLTGRNGATWQVNQVLNSNLERHDALRAMLARYVEYMHANEPVHAWPD